MATVYKMRTHGVAAFLEDNSWVVDRTKTGAIVKPSGTSLNGWVHFAIPTPVVADSSFGGPIALSAAKYDIRVETGAMAEIKEVEVYDGTVLIANGPPVGGALFPLQGALETYHFDVVPGPKKIEWGTVVSVRVEFFPGPGAHVRFVSAGINFV